MTWVYLSRLIQNYWKCKLLFEENISKYKLIKIYTLEHKISVHVFIVLIYKAKLSYINIPYYRNVTNILL